MTEIEAVADRHVEKIRKLVAKGQDAARGIAAELTEWHAERRARRQAVIAGARLIW